MNRSHLLISCLVLASAAQAQTQPAWSSYAGSYSHQAAAPAATQNLNAILWSTPVDLNPPYTGDELFIHYGSPLITHNNVIVIPVKQGLADGWAVEGRNATTGALIYKMATDYSIPDYAGLGWIPTFAPALAPNGKLFMPAAGGTVLRRDNPESATSTSTRMMFFSPTLYNADRANYNANVKICTPLTIDPFGNIYFGFITYGATMDRSLIGAAKVVSGIAKITPAGVGTWKPCTAITGNTNATHVVFNCAPALSPDGQTLYFGVKVSTGGGYLVGLNPVTMNLKYIRKLFDPSTGNPALVDDQGSGAPMVGPDGDVYYGILSNPHLLHNARGFTLHFDKTLAIQHAPGSFGWDNTASVIPSSAVPGYVGSSRYLIVTKYNNYVGAGTGDGVNRVAVLDPNATEMDSIFQFPLPVMQEVQTVVGPTPLPADGFPSAVYEWCINSAVVDVATHSALINSEDGHLYRWDLEAGGITQGILLDGPRGQAYTPTISGPTGIVYAINNAKLFAVGGGPVKIPPAGQR